MRRFGIIHLRSRGRKIARAHNRQIATGVEKVRRLRVNVFIRRGHDEYGAGYLAWACTSKHPGSGSRREISSLAEKRRRACGADAWGRTPTVAVKKALVNLGRKKDLR